MGVWRKFCSLILFCMSVIAFSRAEEGLVITSRGIKYLKFCILIFLNIPFLDIWSTPYKNIFRGPHLHSETIETNRFWCLQKMTAKWQKENTMHVELSSHMDILFLYVENGPSLTVYHLQTVLGAKIPQNISI